ncbi:BTB/POZ domain-containing protein 6-like [Nilaparvata lugens]|uniref:BTB/POZ domain-containing protein 6-like n=1 Tax=Nilaparvata lugens TaxID=108931 RepID=UPI00193D4711|nr:BTB/POZ domain-containing protein 6-like [Nilaparvata lugens]
MSDTAGFEYRFQHLPDATYDCEFRVGGEIIKGHKLIFAAASEVFYSMFYGLLKEEKQVVIEDLTKEGFEHLKNFIYTGKVDFKSFDEARSTYVASNKYLIPALSSLCINHIIKELCMEPSQAIMCYEISCRMSLEVLKKTCLSIILKKWPEIVQCESFLEADGSTMELLVECQTLGSGSEVELLKHVERWALEQVKRKEIPTDKIASSFDRIKKHIRFLTFSEDDIVTSVANSPLLTQHEKLTIALNKMRPQSIPFPDSLSTINKPRSHSKQLIYNKTFIIPLQSSGTIGTIEMKDQNSKVTASICKGYIFFQAETVVDSLLRNVINRNDFIKVMLMTCKLKVIAKEEADDILIENESYIRAGRTPYHEYVDVLAVIPINKLTDKHRQNNRITIEGLFLFPDTQHQTL